MHLCGSYLGKTKVADLESKCALPDSVSLRTHGNRRHVPVPMFLNRDAPSGKIANPLLLPSGLDKLVAAAGGLFRVHEPAVKSNDDLTVVNSK